LGINEKTENMSSDLEVIVELFLKFLLKKLKKKKKTGKNQNTTNFIFTTRSGMGEVFILSIPDLNLLCSFTTTKNDEGVALYNFI
jgi:hypothetical protein